MDEWGQGEGGRECGPAHLAVAALDKLRLVPVFA